MEGKIVEEVSCGRLPKLTTLCYNIQGDEGEGNKEEDKKRPINATLHSKLARLG